MQKWLKYINKTNVLIQSFQILYLETSNNNENNLNNIKKHQLPNLFYTRSLCLTLIKLSYKIKRCRILNQTIKGFIYERKFLIFPFIWVALLLYSDELTFLLRRSCNV